VEHRYDFGNTLRPYLNSFMQQNGMKVDFE